MLPYRFPLRMDSRWELFTAGCGRRCSRAYLPSTLSSSAGYAVFEILSANHPTNRDDATWTSILGSIRLSLLFLAASGSLKRVYGYLAGIL